jgi:fumarylacetoacetase
VTWAAVPDESGFTLGCLPFGAARARGDAHPFVATRIGDHVLPVRDAVTADLAPLVSGPNLDALLAAGPRAWRQVRDQLTEHLTDRRYERSLTAVEDVEMFLPFTVADYVDFYSSLEHATNLGRILRPGAEPLLPNWRHLPVAYHGRAGSVAVSGTPVRRPCGLVREGETVRRGPTAMLDFELEVGFVVGCGNARGVPIAPDDADRHVFGAVLVNDWSARDIQSFDYQPLGPTLGKSFLTPNSPRVVPLVALEPFLVDPPAQDPRPDPFLTTRRAWAIDLALSVELCGTPVTRTNLRHLYWTFAQQLAHLTSNGAVARTGDLLATGTVSGANPDERGSLIELTWRGERPLTLADGSTRTWLEDGDTVVMSATTGHGERRVGFGEVTGTVIAAYEGSG